LLRPNDEEYTEGLLDPPTVWIRHSQRKIHYQTRQISQRRFEVVRITYLRTPHRINADLIINLAYNGVPPEVFSELNQRNIQEIYDSLTTWTGDRAMAKLCRYLERQGGVHSIRLNRLPPDPMATRRTHRSYEHSDSDEEEDGVEDGGEDPLDYFPNLISGIDHSFCKAYSFKFSKGQPATLFETAVKLIRSGFTPQNSSYLAELILQVSIGYYY
jgi:hypothetical protein